MIIHCPKCNGELELPDDAVGRKVQCFYCEEKFFATEEFINNQRKPTICIIRPCNASPRGKKELKMPKLGYEKLNEWLMRINELTHRAESGDAKAQYEFAVKLMNGNGIGKNEAEGVKWLRKAADQGDLNALHDMGVAYFNGLGVVADKVEGARWYRLAAERGNEQAQYDYAICLANGFGVAKDMDQAFFWFKKAAELGRANAMYNVGICYGNGYGVKKDVDEAMKWFRKAADAGDEDARKVVEPKIYTGKDAIDMFHKMCEEWDEKREGANVSPRKQSTSAPQHLGNGTRVDWSLENKVFAEMIARHGISKFHVDMANPYCAEISIPMNVNENTVRKFANDLFHELDVLDADCELDFGQNTDCSVLDLNEDAGCYYVVFNHHDVKDAAPGDAMYKYKVEAISAGSEDDDDDDSDEPASGELTPAQVMKYIADGIKSGEIKSKSGEGYFVLKGEFYDAIKAGRKTTEYRDLSPRNLSKSIGIKTVKLQRGYEKVQMRYEVKSVGLLDADGRECDPYNIPDGFIATTIAIHLGRRIG